MQILIIKNSFLVQGIFGKKFRYKMNPLEENSLDMAVKSSKACLEKANLDAKDIDRIVYIAYNPETFVPPAAIALHHHLGCKDEVISKNMNVNCVGMLIASIETYYLMQSMKHIKNCLIVQSEYTSVLGDPYQSTPYIFSDSSTAVILSKSDLGNARIIDYCVETHSHDLEGLKGPKHGFTHFIANKNVEEYYIDMPGGAAESEFVAQTIKRLLEKNQVDISDIKGFFFSQCSYTYLTEVRELLDVAKEKVFYYADQTGYTGASSPFVALEFAMNEGKVKAGDLCMFWTSGAGVEHAFVLMYI